MQTLPKDGINFLLVHDESFDFNSVCTVKYQPNATDCALSLFLRRNLHLNKRKFHQINKIACNNP